MSVAPMSFGGTGGGGGTSVSSSSSASANSKSGGQFGNMGNFTYNAKGNNDNVVYAVLGAVVLGGLIWALAK